MKKDMENNLTTVTQDEDVVKFEEDKDDVEPE